MSVPLLPSAALGDPDLDCRERQERHVAGTRTHSSARAAPRHKAEGQWRALAGTGAAVLSGHPRDTAGVDAVWPGQTSQSGGQMAVAVAVAAGRLLAYVHRSLEGDRDGHQIQRGVLSGVRESGNLTWAVTDSRAAQTLRG